MGNIVREFRRDFLATITSVVAVGASIFTFGYYLANNRDIISSKITLTLLGALGGFLISIGTYLFWRTKERAKTVFLSYSITDKGLAERIEHDLERDGFHVLNIPSMTTVGENISTRIEEAMSHSNALILLASEHAPTSRWIDKEVSYALQNKLRILPVVTSESAYVPEKIADIKYVSVKDSYDAGYKELKRALQST